MSKKPIGDNRAMTGHVQGFELPRGCLMTTGYILLPVATLAAGLTLEGGFQTMISLAAAVVVATLLLRGFLYARR